MKKTLLDYLFPPRCMLCHSVMENQTELGLCPDCHFEDYINQAFQTAEGHVSFLYEDRLQQAIYRMKYSGQKQYGRFFAHWMAAEGKDWAAEKDFACVTSVPLAKSRRKNRGYNQAEEIARELGRLCRLPYMELLERTKDTLPQKSLGQAMRSSNLAGAFKVRDDVKEMPLHVCLIDDIYTTGSTIGECRNAILEAFPGTRVSFWVLAGRNLSENL